MNKSSYEEMVENLFTIIPFLKKKLVTTEFNKNLTLQHYQILSTLKEAGSMTVSKLAESLNICKPNITPLIQRLIDEKLAERIADETDRRYIHIRLTDGGKSLLVEHKNFVLNHLKSKIADFSEEDLEKLSLSLNLLKEALSKMK